MSRRIPFGALLQACVLFALAAGAATACGSKPVDVQTIVARASDRTASAKTAKVHEHITIDGPSGVVADFTADGTLDFASRRAALTSTIAGQKLVVVLDGTTMYEQAPALQKQLGKPWIKVSLDDLGKLVGVSGLGGLAQSTPNDPAAALAVLRGVGDVTKEGIDKIRGDDATLYDAVVDLNTAAAKAPPAQAKTLREIVSFLGTSKQPLQVWIDGKGRVRRMTETIDYSKATFPASVPKANAPKDVTLDVEYFDFGVATSVHVPARDQVTDIGSMLGAPPASSAANALAAKLLANVPAGYARQSDDVGDTGPSDLDKAVKDDGNADARTVLTKDGFVAGYQALWQKDDGQIIDFLYQFTSATGANDYANRTYADGFSGSTDAKPTTFAVAGIPGAKGLEGHDTDGTSDVVVFTSGGYLVQLVVAGPDASPAFVTRLAQEQYSKLRTG